MSKINLHRAIFICIPVLFPWIAQGAVSVELRSDYEHWNAGMGDANNGAWASAGVQAGGKKFFGGVSAGSTMGGYSITSAPGASLARREAEVYSGLRLTPNVSVYTGYRLFRIEYTVSEVSRSFADNMHGFGGGIGYALNIGADSSMFFNFNLSGVYSAIQYRAVTPVDRGWGYATGGEMGVALRLAKSMNAVVSAKYQMMNVDYGGGQRWANDYVRGGARISYQF